MTSTSNCGGNERKKRVLWSSIAVCFPSFYGGKIENANERSDG